MSLQDLQHRKHQRLAREILASGYVVSTVVLAPARYETAVFTPGWPESGDSVETRRAASAVEALANHAEAAERWRDPPPPQGWFLRLG